MKVTPISITNPIDTTGEFKSKSAEEILVYIARVSSSREDKFEAPEGLIRYLINNKHWSPFEHVSLTFEIVTSKAIGIQLLRHRSFCFQEFSQRYSKVTEFEPIELRKQATNNRQSSEEVFDPIVWRDFIDYELDNLVVEGNIKDVHGTEIINELTSSILHTYRGLLEAGVAKECARMILPMCTQTTIYMTGNLRSWIHFLDVRDDEHAQKEIQLIAKEIKEHIKQLFPITSKALNYEPS